MKRTTVILFGALIIASLETLAQFAEPVDLTYPRGGIRDVEAADLDGDGDLDLITAQDDFFNESGIDWFPNEVGSWGIQQPVDYSIGSAWDTEIADINGDSEPDILASFPGSTTVAWFANDGTGNFSAPNIITDTLSGCRNSHPVDIDGDGDIDVLSVNDESGIFDNWSQVVLYRNTGGGNFSAPETINSDDLEDPYDVNAADVDGDGLLDVVCASLNTDDITWFRNLGGAINFGPKSSIANTLIGCRDIEVADLDADGDMDFTVAGVGDDRAVWIENFSGSSFTVHRLSNPESSVDDCMDLSLVDIDNDGDLDIAAAMLDENDIKIYRNLGGGNFGSFELVADRTFGGHSVVGGDFDEDGLNDLASGSIDDAKLAWYENLGGGTYGIDQPVNRNTSGVSGMCASDVDDDGDQDLVVTSSLDDKVSWFENLGTSFGPQQYISTNTFQATDVISADFNADNIDDLAILGEDELWVYLNSGSGYSTYLVSTALDDTRGVIAVDIDGDSDLDLVTTSWFDSKLAWYENLGAGIFGPQIFLKTVGGADALASSDFDNDGDPDLIVGNEFSDRIAYYENLGGGSFSDSTVLMSSLNGVYHAQAADLDQDGDDDVLAVGFFASSIVWCENLGGGNFGPKQTITNALSNPYHAITWDPDGDGDLDILVSVFGENRFVSIESLGAGNFGARIQIDDPFEDAIVTAVADFDEDGDDDMVGGFSNTTYYIQNLRLTNCNSSVAPTGLSSSVSGDAILSWTPVPGSQGCQVQGRPVGAPSFSSLSPIVGFEVSSATIPASFLTPGQDYEWQVRCACTISPLDVTPFSVLNIFSVPLKTASTNYQAYPNPAEDVLYFSGLKENEQLILLDLQGKVVLEGSLNQSQLDLENLASGMYQLLIFDSETEILIPYGNVQVN
jgi:hypothetical protein